MYITLHFSLYYTKEKMKCHSNLTFSGGITWITDNVFAICGRMQIRRRLRLQNTLVLLRPCTLVMNVEPMRCRSVIWLLCASTIRSLQTISSDLPTEKSLCPLTLPEKNNKSVTVFLFWGCLLRICYFLGLLFWLFVESCRTFFLAKQPMNNCNFIISLRKTGRG